MNIIRWMSRIEGKIVATLIFVAFLLLLAWGLLDRRGDLHSDHLRSRPMPNEVITEDGWHGKRPRNVPEVRRSTVRFSAPPAHYVLSGIVVDPLEKGLANATVRIDFVRSSGIERAATVITDQKGHFTLDRELSGTVRLVAAKIGFANSEVVSIDLSRSQVVSQEIVLRLKPSYRISGIVQTTTGSPVLSASVQARGDDVDANRETTTGADGTFQLIDLPVGRYSIIASIDSVTTAVHGISAGTDDLFMVLPFGHQSITLVGSVVGNNAMDPIANFDVSLEPPVLRVEYDQTQPGLFRAFGLRSVPYRIIISSPNEGVYGPARLFLNGERDLETRVFAVQRSGTIVGKVAEKKSRVPVPHSILVLKSRGNTGLGSTPGGATKSLQTQADENGIFRFEKVPAGVYVMEVRPPSPYAPKSAAVDLKDAESLDLGEVYVLASAVLRGKLIFAHNGAPAAGKHVELASGFGQTSSTTTHLDGTFEFRLGRYGNYEINFPEVGLTRLIYISEAHDEEIVFTIGSSEITGEVNYKGVLLGTGSVTAVSGSTELRNTISDGRFVFRNLDAGTWRIEVNGQFEGKIVTAQKDVVLRTGEAKHAVLEAGSPFASGLVLDEAGEPVDGAFVDFSPSVRARAISTREGGKWRVDLPSAGQYSVRAYKDGFGHASSAFSAPADGESAPVVLRLAAERDTGSIHGIAEHKGTLEPTGALVQLISPDGIALRKSVSGWRFNYEFKGLTPGSYTVRIDSPGYATVSHSELHVEEQRQIKLQDVLVQGGELIWQVADKQEQPLENVQLTVKTNQGVIAAQTTGRHGLVSFSLPPGRYVGVAQFRARPPIISDILISAQQKVSLVIAIE